MYKLGFIGCGNMAQAMIKGILSEGYCQPEDIIVSARTDQTRRKVQQTYGVCLAQDNQDIVAQSALVVVAVKPNVYAEILQACDFTVQPQQIVISLAPDKSLSWLKDKTHASKIVRIMPNTPAAVGEAMTAIAVHEDCTSDDIETVQTLVNSFGRSALVNEKLFSAVVPVSGSSPAYIYMLIEAMADAAVLEGMPRSQAYEFAAQAVLGSAKMVLESGQQPSQLKDAVCSPGGTTIEGVRVLEEQGFRGSIINALHACALKSQSCS